MTQTLTLAAQGDWLTGNTTSTTLPDKWACSSSPVNVQITPNYFPYISPWVQTYCYHYQGPSRPIKLTLSEVERLRAAAKRDAKLKAILAKFTDQIEITVDFE